MNLDNYDIFVEMEVKFSCEIRICRFYEIKKIDCCKENLEKLGSLGEVIGFGEFFSLGEIRFIEN